MIHIWLNTGIKPYVLHAKINKKEKSNMSINTHVNLARQHSLQCRPIIILSWVTTQHSHPTPYQTDILAQWTKRDTISTSTRIILRKEITCILILYSKLSKHYTKGSIDVTYAFYCKAVVPTCNLRYMAQLIYC